MKPLLELCDVHAGYGMADTLRGISLQVGEGEIVALIGANGAGKTTTLMAISGLVPVRRGLILMAGGRIDRLPPDAIVERSITQVPEGRRIFSRLTVRENLLLGAFLRDDRAQTARDLEEVLAMFPVLRQRLRQVAGTLSGGEQQMLALGRGLMARPRLLLLDEPSLGLAPKMVLAIFAIIRRIHERGASILLVEQNAYQALRLAQRGYVLETGSIVRHGSSRELLDDPAVRVAYLGESDIGRGT